MRWKKGQSGRVRGEVVKPMALPDRYTKDVFDLVDGRCADAKAVRSIENALYADLGGKENTSVMEQMVCFKIAIVIWMTGKKEATMIQGGSIDEGSYLDEVYCLTNLLSKIGLKRRARQISLKDYLANSQQPAPSGPQQGGT